MSDEDRLVLDYMVLLRNLSTKLKLKLISKLSESIIYSADAEKSSPKPVKEDSWKSLFGAWKDTDDDLAAKVREGRLPNREIPSFE